MDKNLLQTAKAPMIALIKTKNIKKTNNLKTKTKRTFAALLLLALLAPTAVWAQFGGGNGSQNNPYIISTTDHMSQLATEVNSNGNEYSGVYFELNADLDFQGRLYTPIGNFNHSFAGIFEGNNHTIRNINIGTVNPTGSFLGVFGSAHSACCIKNLTLASSSINGWSIVGGIVGNLSGYTASTDRGIRNCKVASDVTLSANHAVGGIVGIADGDVYHCVNLSSSISGVNLVGSITGYTFQMDYITDCYVIGSCPKGAIGQDGSSIGTDEGADVKRISTITFDAGFVSTYISTSADLMIGSTRYYRCGREILVYLTVDREVPEGYYGKEFLVGDMVLEPIPSAPNSFKFILPMTDNAHVTIGEVKRDIAYTNWVEIAITQQDYTGEALTPAITVTDSKDGTPVTLTEGTHYRLELPSGGCIYPGNYNIPVIGIGDFGNRVTVVFQINNPNFDFEGNGSEQTPYLIQNTDDMDALAQLVNQGFHCQGLHFRLTDDLDYTGKTYTPVGTADNPFSGTFYGNSYTISGIRIVNSSDYLGIFGHIENGTVNYLRLANSTIAGWHKVGGIVGQGKGTIESCYVAEDVSIRGVEDAGGIVGRFVLGSITQCENHAWVRADISNAGGIVGCVEDNAQGVSIVGCINSGEIEQTLGSVFGGIVGKIGSSSACTVEGCINEGKVKCNNYGGGIVGTIGLGFSFFSITLKDNLNLGAVEVSGNSSCGGIVAKIEYLANLRNNYYAGACNLSLGVGNIDADEPGAAMRGWVVSADEDNLFADIFPINEEEGTFVGITFDGIRYVGAGETTKLIIEKNPEAPGGIIAASAGILKPLDEEFYDLNDVFYLLTMPSEGGDVNLSITEGVGPTVEGYDASAKSGWKFIASPVVCDVAAGTVSNIFGATDYDLYRFNQNVELEWENWKQEGDHYHFELENGKGYLYATKETQELVFRGTYNTAETMEVPLTYDANASFAGWNLVGNPFPVQAYANKSYYKMNEAGSAIEPVAVSEETAIPACIGVMVKAEAENETVTFSKTAPEAATNQGNIQIAVAQANTRSNAVEDKAIVSFNTGDALEKFVFNKENAEIYIPQNGKDFAIANSEKQGEMPLNFNAKENGEYTLTFNLENVEMDYLHLIDNMTGADVDLLVPEPVEGPATYTFTAKMTDYESRFRLVFSADEDVCEPGFAFISNGNIIVNGEGTLQIVDVMGRVVVSCGGHTRCVPTNGMTAGVYVLRLIDGNKVKTQKLVIH